MIKFSSGIFIIFLLYMPCLSQGLLINELCTSNITTLSDEDGDYPGWIELYNTGVDDIDLGAYALSDRSNNLLKWRFPNSVLKPQQFKIVFASGKNRVLNIKYWETIIEMGDSCRYFVGNEDPGSEWNQPAFNDSIWPKGITGIGSYDGDDNTIIEPAISTFIRQKFSVIDTSAIKALVLHMDYDDAFVAYLNGKEVARSNIGVVGIPPKFNQRTNVAHEAKIYNNGKPELFDISNSKSLLNINGNILAVEVHNTNKDSDLSLIPFLSLGSEAASDSTSNLNPLLEFPNLHTNFKINPGNENIYLSNLTETIVDSVPATTIPSDYSYGRKPDDTSQWMYFDQSTPGETNHTKGYSNIGKPVEIYPMPGFYDEAITVAISASDSQIKIFYTLDGSTPDTLSNLYTGPLLIDSTKVLRVRSFQQNGLYGPVKTHSFFINESMDIPVISIVTDPDNLWDSETGIYVKGSNASWESYFPGANFWQDWEKPATIQFFEKDRSLAFSSDCGIKITGGVTRVQPQKSLALFFRGKYGASNLNYRIFPDLNIDKFEAFILRNSGNDWKYTLLRDGFMQTLVKNIDIDILAYRPAVAFINGEYWGIHNIREKPNEHYIASHHDVDPNNIDLLERNEIVVYGDNQHYRTFIEYLETQDMSSVEAYNFINQNIDLDEFLNYFISQIYFNNRDWPGNNIKYWRPKTSNGKWRWILFDTDFGFGFWGGAGAYKQNMLDFALQEDGPNWPNPPWSTFVLRKLLSNETIKDKFIVKAADLLNSVFLSETVSKTIDSLDTIIRPEIERHSVKWPTYPRDRDEQINIMHAFGKGRPAYLRKFIMQRFSLTDTVLVNINKQGKGQIKINSLHTDSSPWQGTYFSGVPIQLEAVAVKQYQFQRWSGAVSTDKSVISIVPEDDLQLTAHFVTDFSNQGIVINEINYNSENGFDTGDWIELYNSSTQAFDLTDWLFKDSDDGHIFKFAQNTIMEAGSYRVLVQDDSLFRTKFPDVSSVSGPFNFGLSSKGELIRLYNNQNQLEDSLTYDNKYPWPENADGKGATLELNNPKRNNSLAANWKASLGNGSPGRQNTTYNNIKEKQPVINNFNLAQNYPNPFNPATTIKYSIQSKGHVRLVVYNVLGQKIKVLVNENQPAGDYQITFNATNYAAGLYYYELESGHYKQARKMLFLP